MRPPTTHPKAAFTTRATAALAAGCAGLLLALTGCGSPSAADAPSSADAPPSSASGDKNGDTPPRAQSPGRADAARVPVPRGSGSHVPYDCNGDGHRDRVIDDEAGHGGADVPGRAPGPDRPLHGG